MSLPSILLVDDYPAGLLVSTFMLEDLGYEVEAVNCGLDAIEKVQSRIKPFSAILMDVKMQGMDGFQTTKVIRSIEKAKGYRNIIIAVTAYAYKGDRQHCLDADMDDYISKPINPEILAQMLAAL